MKRQEKKKLWSFLVTTYGLFWGIGIIILALIQFGVLNIPLGGKNLSTDIITIIFSWTPTIAVLIHLKRLFPNTTVKGLLKKLFGQPISWKIILFIILLQISVNALAALAVAIYEKVPFEGQWDFSPDLIGYAVIMSLLTGASGEECGWRGYLLPYFMEKRGCIASSILVGLIWGFWHFPLWLISGYADIQLLIYCMVFMVCVIDWSIIMGILYDWNHNLIIPMLFHFMVNFILYFFAGNDLLYQMTLAGLYTVVAILLCIVYTKKKNAY